MGTVHAPSHVRDLPPESALHVQKHTGSLGRSSQPQHTAIPPQYIQIPKLQESQLSWDIFTDTLEPWCPLVTRARAEPSPQTVRGNGCTLPQFNNGKRK